MKRFILGVLSAVCLLSVAIPVNAQAADDESRDTNNFTITSYMADYYLDRDDNQRSTLKTVEQISAVFPSSDENHGLERAIPTGYDGHNVRVKIESVTDAQGAALPYTTRQSNGNLVLRIGDADRYVHGQQDYKLTYTQHDVTRYADDTSRDEFYWDTNGVAWAVPIDSLTTTLHLGIGLAGRLSGEPFCYFGPSGATNRCPITKVDDSFVSSVSGLQPGENVTLAIGFQPQTFAAYKASSGEKLLQFWLVLLGITFVLAIIALVMLSYQYLRRNNRSAEIGTIVPEYLPPKDVSVAAAASVSRKPGSAFSAQLLDLAVRHYLKLYETRPKSFFRSAQYELEITKDISSLQAEERELLTDIFNTTEVGSRLALASLKNNTSVYKKIRDNDAKLKADIEGAYGLRAVDPEQSLYFRIAAIIQLVAAILTLSPWLLLVAITAYVLSRTIRPLTGKGLDLARYLKGLETYITVAEADRIRMLQSPDGAAKLDVPVDTYDRHQLVRLYERVLPYAVLFGQEKQWNKRLGDYYEQLDTAPSWYAGNGAVFNAAVFSSAMNNFTASASYTSANNSASGGSSGGGSSGGGGGGGGGGGW